MEPQPSLLDMRTIDVQLATANYPKNVDETTLTAELWNYIQRSGHALSPQRDSFKHKRVVAIDDSIYSLWTYNEDNLIHFAYAVFSPGNRYFSCYSNYDFCAYLGDNGLTIEQFAKWDSLRFKQRESIMSHYRDRATAGEKKSRGQFEYGLMTWYLNQNLYPGPMDEAATALTRACEIAPKNIDAWGLLGIVQYLVGNLDLANQAFQHAIELKDDDPSFIYYAAQIALEQGDDKTWQQLEKQAEARSKPAHRPFTVTSNPASRYEDKLQRKAERLRKKIEAYETLTDKQLAEQDRRAITIDPDRVPQELHCLIPLAMNWGIGDDTSRRYFVERASVSDKRALKAALEPLADFANAWLDSIAEGEFSDEASAFLYLLEAAEELLS